MKIANLLKLASYLDTLPDDYEAFEMSTFIRQADREQPLDLKIEAQYALHNGGVDKCGAVACAIGHGPSAGFLFLKRFFLGVKPNWFLYTDHFFIKDYYEDDQGLPTAQFVWMFGSRWADFDNTPKGAAKRIRWLIENKGVPPFDDFEYAEDEIDADMVELYA